MQVLAFDLGASNGRAIVGEYLEGKITLHELHRFSNEPVKLNNYLYWDFPRLFHELKTALIKAKNEGYKIESVGIDSWGVDYGVIDLEGELMANPIQYRDNRAKKGMEKLLSQFDEKELKKRTGMDCVSYNTVNQLMMDKYINKKECKSILNIPDLFNYFLTGKIYSEYSMVSTTQLYDYKNLYWNIEFIEELGFNKEIFNEVISSGTVVGEIKEDIVKELNIGPIKVVSVTSHDTASAIRSVPEENDDFLFIATGTWIIVGSKQKAMTMNEKVMSYGLTNEGGKYPNVNLLKNHVGLWILQELKRYWEKEGKIIGFETMISFARQVEVSSFIDISDERFFEPGNMPIKVKKYCEDTNQQVPESIGEIVKVVEQSLAKHIAKTLNEIEDAVDKTYNKVHVLGGGIQDDLLCELIAEYSKKEVVIGFKEATAYGNVLDQLIALDTIKEEERFEVLRKSYL